MADTSGFNAPLGSSAPPGWSQNATVGDLFNAQAKANNNGMSGLQLWQSQLPGGSSAGGQQGGNPVTEQQFKDAMNQVQTAIANGNQRDYDIAVGNLTGLFNGQPTLASQQALGMINGQPTLDAQKLAEQARESNLSTGTNLLDTAAKLGGPADWGKFLSYAAGGKNLYQQAISGKQGSGAPVGQNQPQTLQTLMDALGMNPSGTGAAAPGAGAAAAASSNPQTLYRQLMGLSPNYSPATMFTPNDVRASSGYANAKASNFATYGGSDPLGGGGGTMPTGDHAAQTLDLIKTLLASMDADNGQPAPTGAYTESRMDSGAPGGGGGSDPLTPDQQSVYNTLSANNGSPAAGLGLSSFQDYMSAHNGNTPGDAWSWANWAAGKEQPAAAATPATPTTPANPPGTGINSTGQSANNKALLDSLGFTQPNLTPTDLTTLGGQGAASIQDVLNSPTYRQLAGQYTSTGSTPYSAVPEVQQYEQKLQTLNNPSAMNPAFWDSLGTDGQQAWLGAAQQIFGWDPTEYVRQINATRPLGSPFAPQSVQTRFAPVGA